MKLAAQTYTIRNFIKNPSDISQSLIKLKDIGYNAIQISAMGECDPLWLKDLLSQLKMQVCATHTPIDEIVCDTDRVIAKHKILGTKYVGIGWNPIFSLEEVDAFCKKLLPASQKLRDNGLMLLSHNHSQEFIKESGELLLDRLLSSFSSDSFGLIADFYWIQRAGLSPEKFIKTYGDRMPVVHFKDMRSLKDLSKGCQYAEIFEGNMDYESIYISCIKAGVKWAVVEQDECDGDPFDSLKLSLENLKKHNMFDL